MGTTTIVILVLLVWLASGFFTVLHDAKTNNCSYSVKDVLQVSLLGLIFFIVYILDFFKGFWNKKVFTIIILLGMLTLSSCYVASTEEHMTITKTQDSSSSRGEYHYEIKSNGKNAWYFFSNECYLPAALSK